MGNNSDVGCEWHMFSFSRVKCRDFFSDEVSELKYCME